MCVLYLQNVIEICENIKTYMNYKFKLNRCLFESPTSCGFLIKECDAGCRAANNIRIYCVGLAIQAIKHVQRSVFIHISSDIQMFTAINMR